MLTELLLCLAWFTISSMNSIVGKTILNSWPRPFTITLVQLMSIYIYLKPLLFVKRIQVPKIRTRTQFQYVLPISVAKFLASSSAHFSLTSVSVSYSHTGRCRHRSTWRKVIDLLYQIVKSMMPFFVVVLSRILLGEKHSSRVRVDFVQLNLIVDFSAGVHVSCTNSRRCIHLYAKRVLT